VIVNITVDSRFGAGTPNHGLACRNCRGWIERSVEIGEITLDDDFRHGGTHGHRAVDHRNGAGAAAERRIIKVPGSRDNTFPFPRRRWIRRGLWCSKGFHHRRFQHHRQHKGSATLSSDRLY